MTATLIRISLCAAIAMMASPAQAQTVVSGIEYRWSDLVPQREAAAYPAEIRHRTRMSTVERIMARAFVSLDASAGAAAASQSAVDFRRTDPELAQPEALRRPRQARLSFRLRF